MRKKIEALPEDLERQDNYLRLMNRYRLLLIEDLPKSSTVGTADRLARTFALEICAEHVRDFREQNGPRKS